jgi:2-phospho-L-lactate guanylyltransferase
MIAGDRIWAVVPVKRFSAAKARLASVLNTGERSELARIMFEDVLDPLEQCHDIFAGVLVITSDPEAAALVRRRGATVLSDMADHGINAAITRAVQYIQAHAGDGLMVVPSDIPQITRNAFVQAAAAIATAPTLAIAAAVDDGGTNLFACQPIGAVPPLFGPCSFDRHRRAAIQAEIAVQVLRLLELSLDIDRPENLLTFLTLESSTRTHEFLSRIDVVERIERNRDAANGALDRTIVRVSG